jgi:hypothetical protein
VLTIGANQLPIGGDAAVLAGGGLFIGSKNHLLSAAIGSVESALGHVLSALHTNLLIRGINILDGPAISAIVDTGIRNLSRRASIS